MDRVVEIKTPAQEEEQLTELLRFGAQKLIMEEMHSEVIERVFGGLLNWRNLGGCSKIFSSRKTSETP